MCIPNDCPPQAIFLDLALCECNFSLKNNVFLLYLGAQISKIFRPSAGQIPIFVFSDTNNPDFFLPDTNNLLTTPPPPGGYEKSCLRPNVSFFISIWVPMR